jgi:hypothetical protein
MALACGLSALSGGHNPVDVGLRSRIALLTGGQCALQPSGSLSGGYFWGETLQFAFLY